MSARSLRRTFSNPFVITFAAALPACTVQSSSPPPQGPQTQTTDHRHGPDHVNPPRPAQPPMEQGPTPGSDQTVVANPPRPLPQQAAAPRDMQWTITMRAGTCEAFLDGTCPSPPPGQPIPPCNPPRPTAYKCDDMMADGSATKVRVSAGQSECYTVPAPVKCPPNVMCNPPGPRKVTCPAW